MYVCMYVKRSYINSFTFKHEKPYIRLYDVFAWNERNSEKTTPMRRRP